MQEVTFAKNWKETWFSRRLEPPQRKGDVRSPWARDYARIIHSAAFRRLQSKTQVLDLGESDFYRTRLTHSMEVAQVSSGLIKCLYEKYNNTSIFDVLPDAQLLSAICLAHDLGHPPYGHGGETALNFCMRNFGGFEGNGQTLRILANLEQYTESHGLNPTRRLLLGILKYPAAYSEVVNIKAYDTHNIQPRWLFKCSKQAPPKCYHDTEQEIVDWVLEPLGNARTEFCASQDMSYINDGTTIHKHRKTLHMSLDASIMDLADDISYCLHDLEDAIAMGMITRNMWDEYLHGKEDIFSACGFSSKQIADNIFSTAEYKRKECIGSLVHYMITHIYVAKSGIESDCPLINYRACFEPSAKKLQALMGEFVFDLVITAPHIQMLEFKGRKTVVELFDVFAANPETLLPLPIKKRFYEQGNEQAQMRVLCDYIACMSDSSAARLNEKLFYPGKGSIFDKI